MIKVLVMSGVRLYREGMADILGRRSGIEITGTAATVDEVSAALRGSSPHVLLLDMPITEGRAVVQNATRTDTDVKVVALGVTESEDEVIAWAEAGVAGYVSREASSDDLAATIQAVARGETLFSPRMAAALLRRLAARTAGANLGDAGPTATLTARERRIVELIDQGLSNKEIASQLCIELSTVKNHVHNILEKLHVHRRSQAAALVRAAPRRSEGAPRPR